MATPPRQPREGPPDRRGHHEGDAGVAGGVPELADRGASGSAPAAGPAGDPVVRHTRRETLMRATRHGYPYARTCAAALALLLGATLAAAPPAAAQANHLKVALQGDTSNVDLHLTTH